MQLLCEQEILKFVKKPGVTEIKMRIEERFYTTVNILLRK